MRGRLLVSVGVLLAAMTASGALSGRAATVEYVPYCYDLRTDQYLAATQWLKEPGTLTGTNGRDVLVGSSGDDVINGLGGNDVICSADVGSPSEDDDADDTVTFTEEDYVPGGFDTINAGSGNDSVIGAGTIDGGSGSDIIAADFIYTEVDDDDTDVVEYQTITVYGGTGNDILLSFIRENGQIGVVLDCGPGNDSYSAPEGTEVVNCEIELEGPL